MVPITNMFNELEKYVSITQRIAGLLSIYDINENICSKINCNNEEKDTYDCVDCIINFFSKPCYWEEDGVCVNDKSEWCADFIDDVKCGKCEFYER